MEMQRLRQITDMSTHPGAETSASPGGSNLAEQARKYAEVARRARDQCQQGVAAEQELQNRRNRSGE